MDIVLNGKVLPWRDEVKHLGNTLEGNNSFSKDCDIKRGAFIGKVHSLLQELWFASPNFTMKMFNIYCSSFYASSLWDIFGKGVERVFTAWNNACRQTYKVPRTSHRYLIETISKSTHPRVFLSSRFVKFHLSLTEYTKPAIRTLANLFKNDLRTVYGNNLHQISLECNAQVGDLSPGTVKTRMKYFKTPENEEWRHGVLEELLDASTEVSGFEKQEIVEMIQFICTT